MNLRAKSLGCVVLLAGLCPAMGCAALGEEVTPAQRELEIIVMGSGSAVDDCYVSYNEMVAGTHGVSVSAEQGTGRARILDASGEVVFEADSQGSFGEGSEDEPDTVPADSQQHNVRLLPGDYLVECAQGSSVSTASLHVTS